MPMLNGSIGRIVAAYRPMERDESQAEFARAGWKSLSLAQFLAQVEDAREPHARPSALEVVRR
jgi:DNA-binding IclR family transcriptional regulator